ncbi:MAG: TlpA family protein disulfide reductase [Pirellulales bacterium]
MMRPMLTLLMVTLPGLLAGCNQATSAGPAAKPAAKPAEQLAKAESKPAATDDGIKLTVVDYDGILAAIAKHKGKVVVIDAWATWCPPCVKEFPGLVALHEKLGPEKVACVSLSFNDASVTDDSDDGEQAALPFLQEQRATFDNLIISNQDVGDMVYRKLKFASIPAVLVYNQEGNLEKLIMHSEEKGAKPTYEQVGELVDKLLADGQ